jgi:hypothetical protein
MSRQVHLPSRFYRQCILWVQRRQRVHQYNRELHVRGASFCPQLTRRPIAPSPAISAPATDPFPSPITKPVDPTNATTKVAPTPVILAPTKIPVLVGPVAPAPLVAPNDTPKTALAPSAPNASLNIWRTLPQNTFNKKLVQRSVAWIRLSVALTTPLGSKAH